MRDHRSLKLCTELGILISLASFSPAEEIGEYFKDVAKRHDIYPLITFGSTVVGARWDEATGKWRVQYASESDGRERVAEADLIVNADGILNDWKWPEIEGLQDFKGVLMHTAAWVTTSSQFRRPIP